MGGDFEAARRRAGNCVHTGGKVVAAIDPLQYRVVAGFNADLEFDDMVACEPCQIVEYFIAQTVRPGADRQPDDVRMRERLLVAVSYTHLRAHETGRNLVCRLL